MRPDAMTGGLRESAAPDHRVAQRGAPARRWLVAAVAVAMLTACDTAARKEAEEAAKNTFDCKLAGERIVIRFDSGEARMLMPGGDRVTLYQIPAASGVRFSNGTMELRGKGIELQLIQNGTLRPLEGCEPYVVPK
jgi:membrane-bound inhibitor of C-type lysozyme